MRLTKHILGESLCVNHMKNKSCNETCASDCRMVLGALEIAGIKKKQQGALRSRDGFEVPRCSPVRTAGCVEKHRLQPFHGVLTHKRQVKRSIKGVCCC